MAYFKYGVTFNTHGNTNGSVYPSPSTQCKMLTSRPKQMLAIFFSFFEDLCPAQSNNVFHSKEQRHGMVILNY